MWSHSAPAAGHRVPSCRSASHLPPARARTKARRSSQSGGSRDARSLDDHAMTLHPLGAPLCRRVRESPGRYPPRGLFDTSAVGTNVTTAMRRCQSTFTWFACRVVQRRRDEAAAASTSSTATHTEPPTLTDRTRPAAAHTRTVDAGRPGTCFGTSHCRSHSSPATIMPRSPRSLLTCVPPGPTRRAVVPSPGRTGHARRRCASR